MFFVVVFLFFQGVFCCFSFLSYASLFARQVASSSGLVLKY